MQKIQDLWKDIDFDPKLESFLEKIKSDKVLTKNKLIIFTESKETATYLQEKLYKKLRNEFYTYLIRNGVFLQPYHHGYIAYRHTEEDLRFVEQTIAEALEHLTKKYF